MTKTNSNNMLTIVHSIFLISIELLNAGYMLFESYLRLIIFNFFKSLAQLCMTYDFSTL